MPGKHRDRGDLNAWRDGRRRALDETATKQAAAERARTEAADIAQAAEKTRQATDAAWPTNTQEQQ